MKKKFSEIPIGGKFKKAPLKFNVESAFSEMICIKVNDEQYSLLNQTRLWKSEKDKEYILVE